MKFIYNSSAGGDFIEIDGDGFSHLKALRLGQGKRVDVRNLRDGYSYIYEITSIDKRKALLELVFKSLILPVEHKFELAWAVVELSVIEKSLPSLNELGVGRLNLVYCEFSQRNIKINAFVAAPINMAISSTIIRQLHALFVLPKAGHKVFVRQ